MPYLEERPAQRLVNVPTATHHWPENREFFQSKPLSQKKKKKAKTKTLINCYNRAGYPGAFLGFVFLELKFIKLHLLSRKQRLPFYVNQEVSSKRSTGLIELLFYWEPTAMAPNVISKTFKSLKTLLIVSCQRWRHSNVHIVNPSPV